MASPRRAAKGSSHEWLGRRMGGTVEMVETSGSVVRFKRRTSAKVAVGGGTEPTEAARPGDTSIEGSNTERDPDPRSARHGPWSLEEVDGDGVDRVDLGSLLIPMLPGHEIRLQVDETSQEVIAAQLVSHDGALEVRAFAAPRNGDLWSRARAEIAAKSAERDGTLEERPGRFGSELVGEMIRDDGTGPTTVSTRLVGFNGDRWLLRGSFVGQAATGPGQTGAWDEAFAAIVVRRGSHALPVGDPLPLTLPTADSPGAG
ncbi:MAG: DUF3710 domain-containing protein [Nocardioides sp.]